ncbi:hypothetical protein [Streptomyces europaeiscabiei]|uniref:hypothetical protein n=1 Tax=Streptomyces europaeiscabiei TaxID=146819 RepID=UPI0029B47A8D|nr:hypothetical protein [Streptomyces europaeiscabiei]MDX2525731.1 hypothetical protein [Streptomyces europaeiscabiei]MDX3777005.1 hypothetical protein [Streptomyces europaeiscabiei]
MATGSRFAAAFAVIASAISATLAVGWVLSPADNLPHAPQDQIIIAHGADNLPSRSATDWVTYADHVVAVTATRERETPPTQSELDRGEGLIGRAVTLRVDQVVWSRADGPREAPTTWDRPSLGWQFTNGDTDNRVKVAKAHSPRIQAGHSYVIAIVWEEDACSPNGGQWRGLGEGSTLPYDNAKIGEGELEGRIRTAAQARQVLAEGGPNLGLKDEMAGKNTTSLAAVLKVTKQEEPRPTAQDSTTGACD